MRRFILAATLTAIAVPALPVMAQTRDYREDSGDQRQDRRDGQRDDGRHDGRRPNRDYRQDTGRRDAGRQDARRQDIRGANREEWRDGQRYDYNRPPQGGRYYADRYYRSGDQYQPRRLNGNDRVYRGQNGNYYCRRSDGTTGLLIGALGGGVLGNLIAPGGSNTLGTLLGAGGGALVGRGIDRNNMRCR